MPDAWTLSHYSTPNPDPGGGGFSGILQEFHVPWPACNQDAARQAADAWSALAEGLEGVNAECNSLVASITTNNSGQAIDAFAAYWQKTGGKSGSLTLTIGACQALAKFCNEFADQVSDVKTQIEHKAEELLAMTAAAAAALIFSFGVSAYVEAAYAGQVVAWVTALIDGIADTVNFTSEQLADDIGFLAEPVAAVAATTVTGLAGGASAGTFAAVFNETFQGALDVVNKESLPTAEESLDDVLNDGATGAMLGILAEATPVVAKELTSTASASEVLNFSPDLSVMLSESSKLAEWLDTAAGKAFIEAGGIEALKKGGWLDETGAEGKFIETLLEGPLSKIAPSAGSEE